MVTKCINQGHYISNEMYFDCNVCGKKKNNRLRATLTTCMPCKKMRKNNIVKNLR